MADHALPPAARRVADAAAAQGLRVDVVRFPDGTRTAADAARAIGCPVAAIVKSLVLHSRTGPLMVLASGANRVDYDKVAAASGRDRVRRASADEARAATGYAIGGTPPFGHEATLPTVVDRDLLTHEVVWAAAGTPDRVFSVAPDALVSACHGVVADVAAVAAG